MVDYVKSTNFASKDSLAIGNPLKIVKGTEIDTEFNNIATAIATKVNSTDAQPVDPQLTALAGMESSRAAFLAGTEGFGFRNRIINGDMRIDQRNAGASVTINSNPVYTVDRWYGGRSGTTSNFTVQRSTSAPAGFTNSLVITAGAGVTPAANDFNFVSQAIEGLNFSDLGWGAAGAQTITISFWARSSLTGTFGVGLRNGVANRSYIASYTINAANTWEYKTVSIPGDTTGTWATDNTQACGVFFDVGCGSTFSSTAGSWSSFNLLGGLTGGVKLAATTGATLNITGVQLEAGSVATPFERRPYGTELALCQRYYEISNAAWSGQGNGSAGVVFSMPMKVTKRASPTVTLGADTGGWTTNFPSPTVTVLNQDAVLIHTNSAPANAISRYNAALAISSEL